MKRCLLLALLFCYGYMVHAQPVQDRVKQIVDSMYKTVPDAVGIMVHVEAPGQHLSWSYATGYAEKQTKKKLTAEQPVLLASNTKTYVSATILKLVEQNKIKVDQPVAGLISPKSNALMLAKGYKTGDITLRHLLSHTSGIDDYVNDDYFEFVNTHRSYKWTRDEQIERAMKVGTPLGAPGDTFRYADVNYLLLTEVIEHCTHKPFYTAIKELTGWKEHKLGDTWFTSLQPKPSGTKPLAHQYWSKYPWDAYDINTSWDLYGGGGIAATTKDLARFFQVLFEGKIIQDKTVLDQIHTAVPCKTKTNYCLGVRNLTIAGLSAYYHGGFWGTDSIYFPELNASVAIFILEKSQRDISASICQQVAGVLKDVGVREREN